MTLWIGKIGSLVELPSPHRGIDATPDLVASVSRTIGGGQVVSRSPALRRTWRPRWTVLDYATYAVLEEFYTGARGPGPWVLLDSARRNHLAPNVASTGSWSNDADGITVTGGELVTSTPDRWLRGPRSLRWTLPATVVSGVLECDAPPGLVGVPVPPLSPWTLSCSLTLTGIAASVTVTAVLSWRRIDGSETSITSGTPVVVAADAWSTCTVSTAAAPADAVAVRAQLRVTPGVIATGSSAVAALVRQAAQPRRAGGSMLTVGGTRRVLVVGAATGPRPGTVLITRAPISTTDLYVDRLQLEMSASVSAWAPGTGVPQCSWVSLSDVEDRTTHRMPVDAVLVEVG